MREDLGNITLVGDDGFGMWLSLIVWCMFVDVSTMKSVCNEQQTLWVWSTCSPDSVGVQQKEVMCMIYYEHNLPQLCWNFVYSCGKSRMRNSKNNFKNAVSCDKMLLKLVSSWMQVTVLWYKLSWCVNWLFLFDISVYYPVITRLIVTERKYTKKLSAD